MWGSGVVLGRGSDSSRFRGRDAATADAVHARNDDINGDGRPGRDGKKFKDQNEHHGFLFEKLRLSLFWKRSL